MTALDQIEPIISEFGLSSFSVSFTGEYWYACFFDAQGLTRYQAKALDCYGAAMAAIDKVKADKGIRELRHKR